MMLPGPGPLVIAPERSYVFAGTHTGSLAGRLEFQSELVIEAILPGVAVKSSEIELFFLLQLLA